MDAPFPFFITPHLTFQTLGLPSNDKPTIYNAIALPYWVFTDDGGWDYKGFYVSVFGFSAHKFVAGNCSRMVVVTVGGQEHLFGHICEGVRN